MSEVVTVVGALWGDEGKGKFVNFMCQEVEADIAVRYSGGANAGHNIVLPSGERYTFRLLPTGSVTPGVVAVLGAGMVIDPQTLVEEIKVVKKHNPEFHLVIDFRAHMIFPFHRTTDAKRESLRKEQIGTTHSGIGTAFADKANRVGMRMEDLLLEPEEILAKVTSLAEQHGSSNRPILRDIKKLRRELYDYIADGAKYINRQIEAGKSVVFAGAQGFMLDVDYGTYPFVTSTSCLPSGVGSGAGVDPRKVDQIIGVVKAYCTRIGEGPFPTEISGDTAETIRTLGNEYEHGVYINRPRRIGWLDLKYLELSCLVGGYDFLAVTMLDVVGQLDKIHLPGIGWFDGWDCSKLGDAEDTSDLPPELLKYLGAIEAVAGVPIGLISTGPGNEQVIDVRGRKIW